MADRTRSVGNKYASTRHGLETFLRVCAQCVGAHVQAWDGWEECSRSLLHCRCRANSPATLRPPKRARRTIDCRACYLLLVEQEGSEIHFKIKRSTKMSKLMDAYCKQRVCVYCADASATHRPHHSATPLGHTRQRAKYYHAINN